MRSFDAQDFKKKNLELSGRESPIAVSIQWSEPCRGRTSISDFIMQGSSLPSWLEHTKAGQPRFGRPIFWHKSKKASGSDTAINKTSWRLESSGWLQWATCFISSWPRRPPHPPTSYPQQVVSTGKTTYSDILNSNAVSRCAPCLTGGGAARAAAAVQNEKIEYARMTSSKERFKRTDHGIDGDRESGVGILVPDCQEDKRETVSPVSKIGK